VVDLLGRIDRDANGLFDRVLLLRRRICQIDPKSGSEIGADALLGFETTILGRED